MTETQPTLGEFLRQERERRGITIEQVASATKISVRLLHLLESDQYVELPAKPFIRGFVMSYCRFIGMDPKEVLIHYGDFLEEHSHDRPARDEGHSGYAFEKREGEQSRTLLSIVMGAFVVLGALVILVLKPSLHHHHNSRADKLRQANPAPSMAAAPPAPAPGASGAFQIIPQPSAIPSVLAYPSATPSAAPSATPSVPGEAKTAAAPEVTEQKPDPLNSGVNLKRSEIKYKIVLKTSADVWVRYQVDDRPQMKFILRSGRVLVLRAQREVRFQTSEPDAITFRVNGGATRALSQDSNAALRGKDLTLFFPKELAETVQDPFPGGHPLLGAFVPAHSGVRPSPSPSL